MQQFWFTKKKTCVSCQQQRVIFRHIARQNHKFICEETPEGHLNQEDILPLRDKSETVNL